MQHYPLYIFEGPDAVGKTELAKQAAEKLGAVYWHTTCTPILAPAMFDYQSNIIENIKVNLTHAPVVLDRLWPSEFCYGPIFRPDQPINIQGIIDQLSDLRPVYIICLDELGAHNAAARHEEMIDRAHPYTPGEFLAVYSAYTKLAEKMERGELGGACDVCRRYYDNRLTNHNAVWHYNDGFIKALSKKYQ